MEGKIKEFAFGIAGGTVAAIAMLLLGVLGTLGYYTFAAETMENMHYFFTLTPIGILLGMIEAGLVYFVFMYLFAWTYNRCTF